MKFHSPIAAAGILLSASIACAQIQGMRTQPNDPSVRMKFPSANTATQTPAPSVQPVPALLRVANEEIGIVNEFAKLPATVQQLFNARLGQNKMAKRGEPFNKTDAVGPEGASLPFRRFVFGGIGSDCCFVVYERGGISFGAHLVTFERDSGNWRFAANAAGPASVVDITTLRSAIKAGKLFAQPLSSASF